MMRRRNKIRVVAPVRKLFLKRGDNVKVLAGNDRGKQGVVKSVDRRGNARDCGGLSAGKAPCKADQRVSKREDRGKGNVYSFE